jgi:hypothetical protein
LPCRTDPDPVFNYTEISQHKILSEDKNLRVPVLGENSNIKKGDNIFVAGK